MDSFKGVLFLTDVVDFSSQSSQVPVDIEHAFKEKFYNSVRELLKKYKGVYLKDVGDAALGYFDDEMNFLLFSEELIRDSRTHQIDVSEGIHLFLGKLRIVADYGKYYFSDFGKEKAELEGHAIIRVFRIEKAAKEFELVVTDALLHVMDEDLKKYGCQSMKLKEKEEDIRNPEKDAQKGFREKARLFKIYFPKDVARHFSSPLAKAMNDLDLKTRRIPIFANLYPALPMEENYIDIEIKYNQKNRMTEFRKSVKNGLPDERFGIEYRPEVRGLRIVELYNEFRTGIIIGLPGAGKTTVLNNMAWREFRFNEANPEKSRIIILVECKFLKSVSEWQKEKPDFSPLHISDILEYFCLHFTMHTGLKTPEEKRAMLDRVEHAYFTGRLTLFVDALDEAKEADNAGAKYDIVTLVTALLADNAAQKIKDNRIFLTSRYSEFDKLPKSSTIFEVLPLKLYQLQDLARAFYGNERPELYAQFCAAIEADASAAKAGGTPLTALLLIAYFETYGRFDTRYRLYDVIVKFMLLNVWEQLKSGRFGKQMKDFFTDAKSESLFDEPEYSELRSLYNAISFIAWDVFENGYEIDAEETKMVFKLFVTGLNNDTRALARAEKWLKMLEKEHLLVRSGISDYVFVHKNVMEFLAARYIICSIIHPEYFETLPGKHAVNSELSRKKLPFFGADILPIAFGADIDAGFELWKILKEITGNEEFAGIVNITMPQMLNALTEFENLRDKEEGHFRGGYMRGNLNARYCENYEAVRWLYIYAASVAHSGDKEMIKDLTGRLPNAFKIGREDFFTGLQFSGYKISSVFSKQAYETGDYELKKLRYEFLGRIFTPAVVNKYAPIEAVVEEVKSEPKEINLLTYDSIGYDPDDKNFNFYKKHTPELVGIYGSPNLKHSGSVRCVVVTSDGKYIVSGSDDKTIKLWDKESGKELRTLTGHSGGVLSLTETKDGKLASGSDDKTIKLWDKESGKELRTLTGHSGGVWSLTETKDGKLVSGSDDKTIKLWDKESGKELRTLTGHSGGVYSLTETKDGKLVSGSSNKTIKLWDKESGKELRTLTGHTGLVLSLTETKDGKLVSGSFDKTIKLWDKESGKELRTLTGHSGWVWSLTETKDGKLVSGSDDKTIKIWDKESGKELRTLTGHSGRVFSLTETTDGKLVSGSYDNTIKLWDKESGKELRTLTGHSGRVWSLTETKDGKLVSGSYDKTIKLWDKESGKELRTLTGHSGGVWSLTETKDGKLVSGSDDNTIKLWDKESGKELRTLTGHSGGVWSLTETKDGKLVSGSEDNAIKLWDKESGKELRTLTGHSGWVLSLTETKDGKLVSGSNDNSIKLWDIKNGKELRTFNGHNRGVRSVTESKDGPLISGSDDNTIKLWDIKSGKELRTLKGHSGSVFSLTEITNGILVSGSDDMTIKIWDIKKGKALHTINLLWIPRKIIAHTEPDGTIVIYSGNGNGTIAKYEVKL